MKNPNYAGCYRQHTCGIISATVFSIVSSGCGLIVSQFLSEIISRISNSQFGNVWKYTLWIFMVAAGGAISKFFAKKRIALINASVTRSLHFKLAKRLAEASCDTVEKMDEAELLEKIRSGTDYVSGINNLYNEIFTIATGVVALIYTMIYSWPIAVMFLLFFSVVIILLKKNLTKLKNAQKSAAEARDKSRQFLLETIEGFSNVKVQSLIKRLKDHFTERTDSEIQQQYEAEKLSIDNDLFIDCVMIVYQTCFILLGLWLTISGYLHPKTFVVLFLYKDNMYSAVGGLARINRYRAMLSTSVQRMDDIMSYKAVSKEHFGSTKLSEPTGKITIKDLTVDYGNLKVLDGLSMEIEGGFIGIVGDSGCGKSTLLRVLSHQCTPTSGDVLLDGVSIFDLDESSLRRAITLAPQQPYIFTLSIKENLLLAKPDASDGEIEYCLKQCCAYDFVEKLGGINAVISPKDLSGGEKQRLALARIPLRGGKIILMDESTSGLDSDSQEAVVQTVLDATKHGHTVIFVAHRLGTLRKADKIIMMDNGKVEDSGTYDELYERSETFRRRAEIG